MDLKQRPKVELHRHLEGSIRLTTAFELAQSARLSLPADSPEGLASFLQVLEPMENLEKVLAVFSFVAQLFTEESCAERLAHETVCDAANENIRLLELRFSPDFMARSAGLDWDRLMEALLRGVQRAQAEHDIAVGLIAIVSRNLGPESAQKTVDFALRWRESLVGFDLADDELAWPSRRFGEILRPIRESGLGLTVHSGEATGPDHVIDTLDSLFPQRIGHGVAVGQDADLVSRILREGAAIEVCPTSNLRTRSVPSLEAHPAKRLFDAGIPISINTDDPGLFELTLTGELEVARQSLGFSDEDLRKIQIQALQSSFLPIELRTEVARKFFGGEEVALP